MLKALPRLTAVIAAACSLIAVTAASPARAQQQVQIAAAANLTKVFTNQIIPAFTQKTGITILPTFGATGLLAKQMESGAPYQVFVSADATTPQKLAGEHLVDPKSVKIYVVGQLALWSPTLPVQLKGLSILTTPQVTKIAFANPQTAPYGLATIQSLTSAKLLSTVQPKMVEAENINQSLQFAQSGNAEVTFTALSLTQKIGGNLFIVPGDLHAPIAQAMAVSVNATPAAKKFAAFLVSAYGQKIFAAAGYLPPSAARK